jgi:hypothetical protein
MVTAGRLPGGSRPALFVRSEESGKPQTEMKMRRFFLVLLLITATVWTLYQFGRSLWHPYYLRVAGRQTIQGAVNKLGPEAEARLRPFFEQATIPYPPGRVTLIGLKHERQLELWADKEGKWVFIRTYSILAASGKPGPKLKEGDRQVPEGIYRIESLNPNSSYHLSMKLDYPNAFDRERATEDHRSRLGGDIFIHGSAVSIGCLALGDPAIEELFALAARIGPKNVRVIVAPNDLRKDGPVTEMRSNPLWLASLYEHLGRELGAYRAGQTPH